MTQEQALEILKLGQSAYITGAAGSGKTHLLNAYIDYLREKGMRVGVTASTGIAATHMNGVTIHSWSGMGIKDMLSDYEVEDISTKRHLIRNFKDTNVLIIDEISMLHSFQLDLVDRICRAFKQADKPFGGMQIILCGDFFQLPPIARRGQSASFSYMSPAWTALDPTICYLEEQYRQGDDPLLGVLDAIRTNAVEHETLEPLRSRYRQNVHKASTLTKLYTHNCDVDRINEQELDQIQGRTYRYDMTSGGNKRLGEMLKKSCLAPEELVLKKGAVVMFVKNNFEEGYVNGTLGEVVDFDEADYPVVETYDGRTITVERQGWKIDEEGKVKAEVKQIPLRLAWAITVHKSQGMSLDAAEIDLSKSFVKGMGYVALSRVRSLNGIKLMGLNPEALRVDEEILAFDNILKEKSVAAVEAMGRFTKKDIQKLQEEFAAVAAPKSPKKLTTYEETHQLLKQQIPLRDIIDQRELTEGTILSHLEKLREQEKEADMQYLRETIDDTIFKKIEDAFKATSDTKLTPVHAKLKGKYTFEDLRFVRLFIEL